MANTKSISVGLLASGLLLCSSLILVSWNDMDPAKHFSDYRYINDTTPEKNKNRNPKNIEEVIVELENARVQLERSLEVDMKKMQLDLEAGLKEIDAARIKMEVEKSLKAVDFEKIRKELRESLDKDEFREELAKAEIELEKAQREFEKVQKKDLAKMEEELARVKIELKDIRPRVEEEMKKAKVELEKARASLEETKEFVDALDREGLIDKDKNYKIEHKNGELIINGKKQPESIYNKFKDYLKKHENMTIQKDAEGIRL